jgi:hypothetical protein
MYKINYINLKINRMKKIAAITMVRNDDFFLERWIKYYGEELGDENIFIIFDGIDQIIPEFAAKTNTTIYNRVAGKVAKADRGRIDLISDKAAELLKTYDIVIGTDVDEFILVDPRKKMGLIEYISSLNIKSNLSALGIDIGQNLNFEAKIDSNEKFLVQRKFALLSSRYTKASIISKPVRWGAGFHRVKHRNFRIDPHLFLFHFGCVDYEMLKNKLQDKDKIQTGWERHLRKRSKTIKYISCKKVHKAKNILNVARIIQSFCRQIFAWNKPSMLNMKIVIELPDFFIKNPKF